MRLVLASVLLLAVPVGVSAEPAAATAPKVTDRDDPNYVICRREEVTGSLAQTKKTCMTRADWALRSRNAQDAGTAMQQSGRISQCNSPGGCP